MKDIKEDLKLEVGSILYNRNITETDWEYNSEKEFNWFRVVKTSGSYAFILPIYGNKDGRKPLKPIKYIPNIFNKPATPKDLINSQIKIHRNLYSSSTYKYFKGIGTPYTTFHIWKQDQSILNKIKQTLKNIIAL